MSSAPVSLGKGAWCCDTDTEIPPEREAEVFEERATEDIVFHGMPTIPPRKNTTHVSAFHEGCRYRVSADHEKDTVEAILKRMWRGGLGRGRAPKGLKDAARRSNVPTHKQLRLFYAGRMLDDSQTLERQNVPRGCKSLACVDFQKKTPGAESAYWN
jgi:hypothetical protein